MTVNIDPKANAMIAVKAIVIIEGCGILAALIVTLLHINSH